MLQELAKGDLPAMQEVHARLSKLYPDYIISHMPSDVIQQAMECAGHRVDHEHEYEQESCETYDCMVEYDRLADSVASAKTAADQASDSNQPDETSTAPSVDCNQFVGNAAVYGDAYSWHVDADPADFPPSPWTAAFGNYCNGQPGEVESHALLSPYLILACCKCTMQYRLPSSILPVYMLLTLQALLVHAMTVLFALMMCTWY